MRLSSVNFDNVMTKFIINKRTDAWKTDVNLFFYKNKTPKLLSTGNKWGGEDAVNFP